MQVNNLILDGTNIEFRIFYITRGLKIQDENIKSTNCIFKFLQTFKSLVEKFNPVNIYAAWDRKILHPSTNFRKEILLDQYKAGRIKPPDIQEMYDQEIRLIEMLETLGVKNIFPNVLEADDVCAWLTNVLSGTSIVVSVDQDLLQLVKPNISVYNLKELITYENFESKKGIIPEKYVLYKAIKGDISDNIIGVPGYGEIKAKKLALNYDEHNLLEENKQIIKRNLQLMDLHYGYNYQSGEKQKYEEQLNYVKSINGDVDKFKFLCEKYNFELFLNDINRWKKIINRNNIFEIINNIP